MSEQNPSSEQPSQQSFGSAPGGQQSFGSAPGGQETFGSAPQPPAEPEQQQPAKKKGILGLLGGVGGLVGIVIIVVLGVAVYFFTRSNAVNAEVGQCLAGTTSQELNAEDLHVVDCTAADAGFKVVGKVSDKTFADSDPACAPFTETEFVFWSGKQGEEGTVLCLASVQK